MRNALQLALAASVAVSAPAIALDETTAPPAAWRNQGGSINYAPRPGVFEVVAVDEYNRVVRLRSRFGAEADVYVDDRIQPVSALRPGDRIEVDFFVPQDSEDRLSAASIWTLR
jgi:hypothetical protein